MVQKSCLYFVVLKKIWFLSLIKFTKKNDKVHSIYIIIKVFNYCSYSGERWGLGVWCNQKKRFMKMPFMNLEKGR